MTAKGKQRAFDYVAPLDEAIADEDLFPPEVGPVERVGLVAIAAAMVGEAERTGESVQHLEKGCLMRLSAKDDRRRLVVWRNDIVPSATELRTLQRTFQIPSSRVVSWEQSGSQLVAVFRWSLGPAGEIYQDYETIAEIRAMVGAGLFREARGAISRVHGNREKNMVFDLIMDAQSKAKEAANAESL